MNQRYCPFCGKAAQAACEHLALAVEGRDFVGRCVESCHGERLWRTLCQRRRTWQREAGEWSPEPEDFTWLETAFCDQFLRQLSWFGGLDYEWRSGPQPEKGGFWVLLWSKNPRQLWWQLREEIERQGSQRSLRSSAPSWPMGGAAK
jgi:hypothetical protein